MSGMASLGQMFGAAEVRTFMGLPAVNLGALQAGLPAVIYGAGAGTSYANVGAYCAGGPAAIRAAGATYAANLAHQNFDLGGPCFPGALAGDPRDLPVSDGVHEENRALIRQAAEAILAAGSVPVLLGGDDSVPIPLLQAFEGRRLHVLQIDAHADWRDEVQGERWGLSSTMRRASEMAHVAGIVQVGQRGIGSARPGDVTDAERWGVTFVPAREMARSGLARALAAIPAGAEVAVCLDCDALDPGIMPGVIGRTAGGLSHWDVVELIAGVAEKVRIVAFDMVEFMPECDVDGLGAMTAAQLLATVLGLIARQAAA